MSRKKLKIRGGKHKPKVSRAGLIEDSSVAKLVRIFLTGMPVIYQNEIVRRAGVTEEEGVINIVERHVTDKERKRVLKLHRKAAQAHTGQIGNHSPQYLAAIDVLHDFIKNLLITCHGRDVEARLTKDQKLHEVKLLENIKALIITDYSDSMRIFRRDLNIPEDMPDDEMYATVHDRMLSYLTISELHQIYGMQREIMVLAERHHEELVTILEAPTRKDATNVYITMADKGELSAGAERVLALSTQIFLVLDRLIELTHARMTGKLFKFSEGYGSGRSQTKLIAGMIDGGDTTIDVEELPDDDEQAAVQRQA